MWLPLQCALARGELPKVLPGAATNLGASLDVCAPEGKIQRGQLPPGKGGDEDQSDCRGATGG